jgi:hypothetical protein
MTDADAFAFDEEPEADTLPTVYLDGSEMTLRMLRHLQAFVLKHPDAAKAAFVGLVAEGAAFAQTPEGKQWRDKLAASELIHRARLILDLPGLSMLARDGPELLPSAYVDALFMLANHHKPDELFEPPDLGGDDGRG